MPEQVALSPYHGGFQLLLDRAAALESTLPNLKSILGYLVNRELKSRACRYEFQ